MTIILIIGLSLAAIALFSWYLKSTLNNKCPYCKDANQEGAPLPVIPWFRWWCLVCGNVFSNDEMQNGLKNK